MATTQRLTARFEVSLSSSLFVNRRISPERLRYTAILDDWYVEIRPSETAVAAQSSDRTLRIWEVFSLSVSVTHDETTEPPGEGSADEGPYFEARVRTYEEIAVKALSRFLRFFKYRQAHALLREPKAEDFDTLMWSYESDEGWQRILYDQSFGLFPKSDYGMELDDEVGVRALAAADDPMLQQALTEPIEPELYEELLSDARAALCQGHLRRAILELALSCEIATKQAFFGKESAAASAYEYLEDKGWVRASVSDLLGQVAQHAFGSSFRDANSDAHKQIDHLFRCRNKIAHRGECKYNDDQGRTHTVDYGLAREWFKSAEYLLEWLQRVTS